MTKRILRGVGVSLSSGHFKLFETLLRSFILIHGVCFVLVGENAVSAKVLLQDVNMSKSDEIDSQNRVFENIKIHEYYDESFEDLLSKHFEDDYEQVGDVEVRFITEDDIEESYHDAEELLQKGPQILEQDPRCPDLPQVSTNFPVNLCNAKTCSSDLECSSLEVIRGSLKNSQGKFNLICCFNGCVHSCLPRVDPPKAFDWVEDTEVKLIKDKRSWDGKLSLHNDSILKPKILFTDEDVADKVGLPGGCFVSQKQLQELRLFRKYDHVEACTCFKGEVVCHVNSRFSAKLADAKIG